MAKGCFDVQKTVLVRDHPFFAAFLSEVGVDNIDTRVAQAFVWTIVKYVVKSSDELFFMCKGYSEIVSVWWSRSVEIVVINRQEITQQKIFTFF